MLENILNNVNATQETLKPKNDVKKPTEDSHKDTTGVSFKNLLEKNLSKDDKTIKEKITEEKPKSAKSETFSEAQNTSNGSFSHLAEKNSPFASMSKTDLKNTSSNSNHSSPTKDLLNAPLAKNNPQDISTKNTKPTQNPEKKLSDIKTLSDEKDLKADNIKFEKKETKNDKNISSISSNTSTQSSQSKSIQSETLDSKTLDATSTNKPMTQNVLDQKLKTANTATSIHKKDQNKPLNTMLKNIDEKELQTRKKFNKNHKIEYKIEDKTEKIAIIERGKNLPKNIVEPKIYQEKRAAKLEEMDTKNQAIQEAINKNITKDIKLTNSPKNEKIEDAKEDVQKKTKKSSTSSKPNPRLNSALGDVNGKNQAQVQTQDQNKQIQNQIDHEKFIDQEKTLQSATIQKNKKTTQDKEVEKTKDKTTQDTSIQKDSTSTLGVVPKNDLLYKSASAKETIKNFAQNLSEEIKNYKPPMSKLSLELNPEKLGKVELTIKQIGNNLHVSVVSNNQAIALFVQNQVDLRQNLAMIGFSGVDLNFSSQDNPQKENQDSGNQKRNKNSLKEYEEVKNTSQTQYDTMEIVLPKYA
ncbi:flagellar hook-length control protein FliK [Helicobacter cappadocius]|uniref:Flagellar hook-length control protein FliK n=1 Tax=Helicobacter cappadocius TaxID=3063998 RepID=A0AA90STB0_9HELI|nr:MULTISPECIES: flagellar hook-length control protein FliK [unclassified Helicobacter]MDO7253860.1 flagellar hook-length control protein FliK [Helicobacter sp. faydin-H75]MDP2539794.1 flagellar hook-length control protein FliK [Helicobacter sp. faydin-H76]